MAFLVLFTAAACGPGPAPSGDAGSVDAGSGDAAWDVPPFDGAPVDADAASPAPACDPGVGPAPDTAPSCEPGRSSDLNGLDAPGLIAYLRAKPTVCLRYLWTLDASVSASLSNDAHVSAVAEALREGAASYAGDNAGGEASLLFYLRLRWYHGFYSPDRFAGGDSVLLRETTLGALDVLASAVDPARTGQDEHHVVETLIHTADGAGLMYALVPLFTGVLNAGADAINAGTLGATQANSLFALLVALQRNIRIGDEAFVGALDDGLFASMRRLILDSCGPGFVINNAIYTMGALSSLDAFAAEGQEVLTAGLTRFRRLSEPFLWLVGALEDEHECMTSEGERICRDTIRPEVEDYVFPNTWVMGDGSTVFRTSLPFETCLGLHYALEQVRARVARLLESAPPVEGDTNDVATFKIYGSPALYRTYNTWLYGISTDNGGIYIEPDGTLYTYDRLPEESVFSLDELVRHEYVHYLLGRYAGAGLWGEHPIYDGQRMTYYDEGLAEFLAGSTSHRGVLTRPQLVENVRADTFMNVDEITRSTYESGTRFYNYAGLFFNYLYDNRLADVQQIMQAAREGDVARFEATTQSFRSDAALNTAYHAYLDSLLNGPELEDVGPIALPTDLVSSVEELQTALRSTRLGAMAECTAEGEGPFQGFVCTGQLSGELRASYTATDAWRAIDTAADELLEEAVATGLSNFSVTTCAFEVVEIQGSPGSQYPSATFRCTGPRDM